MEYMQLSLFDQLGDHMTAICLFDGQKVVASQAKGWMKKLVPDGELVVMIGDHLFVQSPTWLTEQQIRQGHRFYHYLAGGVVYSEFS